MSSIHNGYIALLLNEESSALLKAHAKHPHIYCDHATLAYKPNKEAWAKYEPYLDIKQTVSSTGIQTDERGQAMMITGLPSENPQPHITISCADGVPPKYSNEMLTKETGTWQPLELTLTGIVSFIAL